MNKAIKVCTGVLAFFALLPSCGGAGLGRCIMTPDGAVDGRELYTYPPSAAAISLACKYSTGSNNVTVAAKLFPPEGAPPLEVATENSVPPTDGAALEVRTRAPKAQQGDLIFTLTRNGSGEFPSGVYGWYVYFDDGGGDEQAGSVFFTVAGGDGPPAE